MKKEAVIINITIDNEVYTVSYESGTVRTYKKATKPISAWLEAHSDQSDKEMVEEVSEVSNDVGEEVAEEVAEEVIEEVTEEAVEAVKVTVMEETTLVALEPAEVVVIEEETAAEVVEEVSEPVEVIDVIQGPAEAPAFDWREAAKIAKAAIKALVAACRTATPVIKAGCISLWHLIGLVAMAMVSLVKTIRLYGPDVIAEVVTDAKVAYYKTKALYFRTRRLARASVRAARRAGKLARKAAGNVLEVMDEGVHIVAGAAVVVALTAIKMASVAMGLGVAVAGCAKEGWELREEMVRENKEA